MPIFKAIGLGVAILVLQILMPSVVKQLEETIVAILESLEHGARLAELLATPTGASHPYRLTLPQAPSIRRTHAPAFRI